MRVLFLTPQLPYPPHKGTTLRNYCVIAGLTEDEIQVIQATDRRMRRSAEFQG